MPRALGICHAQGFDLNVDLHSVDVNDVAPPTVKLNDAKCHASLLSNFLLNNSLHFGVNEILSFQKTDSKWDDVNLLVLDVWSSIQVSGHEHTTRSFLLQ